MKRVKKNLVDNSKWKMTIDKIKPHFDNVSAKVWGDLLTEFGDGYWSSKKRTVKEPSGYLIDGDLENADTRRRGQVLFTNISVPEKKNLSMAKYELFARCRLWLGLAPSVKMFKDVCSLCQNAGFDFLPGRLVMLKFPSISNTLPLTGSRLFTIPLLELVATERSISWIKKYALSGVLTPDLLEELFQFKSYRTIYGEFVAKEDCALVPVAIAEGQQKIFADKKLAKRVNPSLFLFKQNDFFYPYSLSLKQIFYMEQVSDIIAANLGEPQQELCVLNRSNYLLKALPEMGECFLKNPNQGTDLTKVIGAFDPNQGRYRKKRHYNRT